MFFAVPWFQSTTATAQPARKPDKVAEGGQLPALATRVAFPNLTFDRPVAMAYPDDGSNRLFVVEQHKAKIWSFPNDPNSGQAAVPRAPRPHQQGATRRACSGWPSTPNSRRTSSSSSTTRPMTTGQAAFGRLSVPDVPQRRPARADPPSEERIWVSAEDPFENHNGGTHRVRAGRLPLHHAGRQRCRRRSPVHRPEPDATGSARSCGSTSTIPPTGKPYGIPADNPARRSQAFAHWATEVYCIGLRNVWKFSFDRKTGDLWAGDVGQNLWEMVHRIENGGNYGWSIREGFHAVPAPAAAAARPRGAGPAADRRVPSRPDPRPARHGLSITGGYVYRGKKPSRAGRRLRLRRLRHRPDLGPALRGRQVIANGELIDVHA